MRRTLIYAFIICIIFSCGTSERNPLKSLKPADGGVYYGGTFRYNEYENFKSLYPLNITETVGWRIVIQISEGLVRLSQRDLSIQPALAESWEIDSTLKKYIFHIREGVKFHDDPCFSKDEQRDVTAHDFKYCFDKLCSASPDNEGFYLFSDKVIGANEYYESTKNGSPLEGGVSGVKVIDDYTLSIELIQPHLSFMFKLAMPFASVFPKEAYDKYGIEMRIKAIGTGPFKLKELKEDEALILSRNKEYWGKDDNGNQLPYLDAIKVSFIGDVKSALLEFNKENFDMIYRLPIEMLDEIMTLQGDLIEPYTKYQLQRTPALTLQYYGFQHQSEVFKDKRIRKAFNYAVDRRKLVNFTMKGVGIQAIYGVVPPALVGYNAKEIKGYEFDADRANKLLAEAGYPGGENFPEFTLQINAGGGRNIQIAEAVQKMLEENLNINVKISKLPWGQHLENLEAGKALFWRSGWTADYPDPETFLNMFYSVHIPKNKNEKSYLNTVRYSSTKFDSLFQLAVRTSDEDERNMLYLAADQTAIDDAVIMPLFYDKNYRLLQPYVKDLYQNPMEYRNFRAVYFSPE